MGAARGLPPPRPDATGMGVVVVRDRGDHIRSVWSGGGAMRREMTGASIGTREARLCCATVAVPTPAPAAAGSDPAPSISLGKFGFLFNFENNYHFFAFLQIISYN